MTEEEIRLAVQSVRSSLAKSALSWILREVDETLRLGKPAVRSVLEEPEESPELLHLPSVANQEYVQKKPSRRRTTVPTTESYSAKEELTLLLDAIQRTAIATMDMQLYVVANVANRGESGTTKREIAFERDGEQSSTIPYNNQAQAETQLGRLREAIDLLRERAK